MADKDPEESCTIVSAGRKITSRNGFCFRGAASLKFTPHLKLCFIFLNQKPVDYLS